MEEVNLQDKSIALSILLTKHVGVYKNILDIAKNTVLFQARNLPARISIDPLDIQCALESNLTVNETGYNVSGFYIPSERFSNIAVVYNSEVVLGEDGSITSTPKTLKFIPITTNDERYTLPHRVTGNPVKAFRTFKTTNREGSELITNIRLINKSYSNAELTIGSIKKNNGNVAIVNNVESHVDNKVLAWFTQNDRLSDIVTTNELFFNSRYEELSGYKFIHGQDDNIESLRNECNTAINIVEEYKSSNPFVKDIVANENALELTLAMDKSIYKNKLAILERNNVLSSKLNVRPDKNLVRNITKQYLR